MELLSLGSVRRVLWAAYLFGTFGSIPALVVQHQPSFLAIRSHHHHELPVENLSVESSYQARRHNGSAQTHGSHASLLHESHDSLVDPAHTADSPLLQTAQKHPKVNSTLTSLTQVAAHTALQDKSIAAVNQLLLAAAKTHDRLKTELLMQKKSHEEVKGVLALDLQRLSSELTEYQSLASGAQAELEVVLDQEKSLDRDYRKKERSCQRQINQLDRVLTQNDRQVSRYTWLLNHINRFRKNRRSGRRFGLAYFADKIDYLLGQATDAKTQANEQFLQVHDDCRQLLADIQLQQRAVMTTKDSATERLMISNNQLKATEQIQQNTIYEIENMERDFNHKHVKLLDEVSDAEGSACFLKDIRNGVVEKLAKLEKYKGKIGGTGAKHHVMVHDCELTPWQIEHPCSQTCDPMARDANSAKPGKMIMIRQILREGSADAGITCGGENGGNFVLKKETTCNAVPCAVNCDVSDWSPWGECSAECGSGQQGRVRSVVHQAKFGGLGCPSLEETRPCNEMPCQGPDAGAPSCPSHQEAVTESFNLAELTGKQQQCSRACGGGLISEQNFFLQQQSKQFFVPFNNAAANPDCPTNFYPTPMPCNTQECLPNANFTCNATNLVLVVDVSASTDQHPIEWSKSFIQKMEEKVDDAMVNVRWDVVLFGKRAVRAGKGFDTYLKEKGDGGLDRTVGVGGTNLAAGLARAAETLEKMQEERDTEMEELGK